MKSLMGLLMLGVTVLTNQAFSDDRVNPIKRLSNSGDIVGVVDTCVDSIEVPTSDVYLPGMSIGAKTGPTGEFRLLNVPQGRYTLVVESPFDVPISVDDVVVERRRITDVGVIATCEQGCKVNDDCNPGFYCQKAEGNCDGVGQCAVKPEICLLLFDPVCGCDDVTYNNACEAAVAGVNVLHKGACGGSVCFNNAQCSLREYCKKPDGQCKGPGSCQTRPEACIDIYAPVCGCDGNTYSNECYAAAEGISVLFDGECDQVGLPKLPAPLAIPLEPDSPPLELQ